ncbi:disease resistance protein At4g27190-like [Prosopis cineraria]|uniref:disease resistance protein At4g27190-like n=1 Tax=Prosopis cineraria TaxID=364024 RepID=UPI00240F88B9|nr:disease resistance protein At4g27190-like [Prosopis cineraria]
MLANKMNDATNLIESCKFDKVARPADHLGICSIISTNFMDFESRKSKSKELVKALENGNYYIIGLQGLGGTGKTTLVTQAGKQVEESKAFHKVIFTVVSNPPNIKKIQQNIAMQLDLPLEEGKEEKHSEDLWKRIVNIKGKILIILDDVWEKLDLRGIGIPNGLDQKNCCVLITTRDTKVCEVMRCHLIIALQTLNEVDALNLFKENAGLESDNSSKLGVAREIVKECGGLPLAIVTVATTLKGWNLRDWKNALKTLQNSGPLQNIHQDLVKVYRSMELSYNYLGVEAQKLLLLCSLFPEDYEIPISLLSKLGVGLGLFGEADNYSSARRKVIPVKNDLIKSSLLLEPKESCVKTHDLVREVAL